jgi:membrane protease YdiL (CAAX protease family)
MVSAPPPEATPDEPRPDVPPWPLWVAPAAVAAGFAAGLVASSLVALVGQSAGSSLSHPTAAVSLIGDLVFDLAFVGAALYFAGMHEPLRARDFGFRRASPRVGIGAILLAAAGYYGLTAIYASLVHLHGSDKLPSELGAGKSTAALVAAGAFVCVIAPVAEEFFFRGFLFGALRRWRIVIGGRDLGTWLAAAIVGMLFGLAHTGSASSQYLIPLGFLGFVLCLMRWKTRSLYPCIVLHSANNSLALGVNQLHWSAAEIIALVVASLAVIGAATAPLARPRDLPA